MWGSRTRGSSPSVLKKSATQDTLESCYTILCQEDLAYESLVAEKEVFRAMPSSETSVLPLPLPIPSLLPTPRPLPTPLIPTSAYANADLKLPGTECTGIHIPPIQICRRTLTPFVAF